jgi:hypothetical protein
VRIHQLETSKVGEFLEKFDFLLEVLGRSPMKKIRRMIAMLGSALSEEKLHSAL